ncbi:MAG TPA: glucose-1-phosphate adenylyltransferase [bacterium]|nr:glucose-1-phosphate adenylyltransferase [bacterium]
MTKYDTLNKTLTIILAGGQGTRLAPLTIERAKPAVKFAGKYRIIDFVLSNCLNSGLRKIAVLTQYRSESLDNHIHLAWNIFNYELKEFIHIVPPQHNAVGEWYTGTADAIYKNIHLIEQWCPEYVLILSGDHLYKMNYWELINYHKEKNADLTVATIEYPRSEAHQFGIVEVNDDWRIVGFEEKPKNPKPIPSKPDKSLSNMGIYVFSTQPLIKALVEDARKKSDHDFGKNVIPMMIQENYKVYAYNFYDNKKNTPCYWRDIGTIDAYFDANMEVLKRDPKFDFYDKFWQLRTLQEQAAPAKIVNAANGKEAKIVNSMVSGGCIIEGATVINSIVSYRVVIHQDALVENSIMFEHINIGKNVKIKNAIIDKNVRIADNLTIGYDKELDKSRGFTISERGITVVPMNKIIDK